MNDSDGNRTRVTAVKGRCLNRLTTEPYFKQFTRDESYNSIYFYSLQAFFEKNLEKIVSNFYCNLSWICAILYEYAAMVELAYGICLESRRAARLRGFKSLSLRYRGRGKIHFAPSPLLYSRPMKSAVSVAKAAASKRHTSLCGCAQYNLPTFLRNFRNISAF